MREVLNTYKDRLVNISGRNRSLVLRKIYKKRTFDIAKAFKLQDLVLDELIDVLLHDESKASLIIDDAFKVRKKRLSQVKTKVEADKEEELEALKNALKKQEGITEEDQAIISKRQMEIQEKYFLRMSDESKKIEADYEALLNMSNAMQYLSRETQAIEKETGKYELYVGYPFVEGRFKDGSFVRAPFFLFPISIEKENNCWHIRNNPNRDPMVNKVFLFAGVKCHQIDIKDYDDLDFNSLSKETIIDFVDKELESMGLITDNEEKQFSNLTAYTKATTPNYKFGELYIKSYVVAGQFPISNAIYTDYEDLEDVEGDSYNTSLQTLLMNKTEKDKEVIAFDQVEVPRKELYMMAPVDYSQETAIKALTKTSQLVIYGPPGTGKSQTITNMISDALAKGKSVLMVSQKRAALDVLYNRLAPVQSKMMIIHDANKDKRKFFDALRLQLEEGFDIVKLETRVLFEQNAEEIDKLIDELKQIEEELTKETHFGISLQQMYIKSDGIFDTEDPRYENYKVFREDNPFMEYTYQTLSDSFEKLNKQPFIVDTYFKYAILIEKNPYLTNMTGKLSFMEKDSHLSLCEKMKGEVGTMEQMIPEVFNYLVMHYSLEQLKLEESALIGLAGNYNRTVNKELEDNESVKWWNVPKIVGRLAKNKEIKEKQRLFEEEAKKYETMFKEYGGKLNVIFEELSPLFHMFDGNGKNKLFESVITKGQLIINLEKIVASLNNQDYYNELILSIHSLDTVDIMLLEYGYRHGNTVEEVENMLENLLEYIVLEHIHEIEKTESFNEFYLYFNRFEQITTKINELMQVNETLSGDIVKSYWNDRMQVFLGTPEFKELKRQAEKKRRLWPIRNMINEFNKLMFTVYPCWLMSPETVSSVLPLQADLFDLIIFDEASQMYVENAIPTIYRGQKVVVSGDDKQLRPTSAFVSRLEEDEEEFVDIETAAALEEESLLDLAKVNYDQVYLNYHYRSQFEELIQFSNHAFYTGRLNVSPNRIKSHYDGTAPIERIKVDGLWEDRKNSAEANRIVELVDQLLKTRANKETIGIITFNINQKDLIEDLLEARCQFDETFKTLYQEELVRKKHDEDVSIFVKNIENVQGDERDIIIFSVGYAKNPQGKISVNFGSLSMDGGENRLNVAISRAKRKIYVITSIEPEELMVAKTKNNGAKLFRKYLQYAKEVSELDVTNKEFLLNQLSGSNQIQETIYDEFVEELASKLKLAGYDIHMNVGSGRYKLDLAIWDPRHHAYILGIECDTMLYPNTQTTLERDIYRQRFYQARGWDVIRVWSYDWWKNPNTVLEKVNDYLKAKYQVEPEINMKPVQTTTFNLVEQDKEVRSTYGDRVKLIDLKSSEVFIVEIDATEQTKENLNEFKKLLINITIGDIVEYRAFEYQVHSILKKN